MNSATKKAFELSEIFFRDKKDLNIALTGGKFGTEFSNLLSRISFEVKKKNFYLTDERISKFKEERNYYLILKNLKNSYNLKNNNFNKFTPQSIKDRNFLNSLKVLDLVFLSLGEDGHLAGHFPSSTNISDKICYTNKATLKPLKRVSFRLDFLMLSKRIILIVLGKEKESALISLINGKNIHSKSILGCSSDFFLITNLDITRYIKAKI